MNFAVYSKDGCPYCDKIKQVLDLTKTSYVVYNLGEQFDRESFYDEFGEGATFPQVSVDGRKLGGCIDTIKYLKENQIIKV
jgi:glutaredoxin|tara:strand:+ start:1868 stop:2110 length:243 start_codon:yes stop_codon:yes gene_type:complete